MSDQTPSTPSTRSGIGILDKIEWVGNKLPDPATLFLLGTILVMLISHVAFKAGWSVEKQLPRQVQGSTEVVWEATGETFEAKSLLDRDGIYWSIKSMVDNFMNFPPLGVVLVGMLGIGIAERTGFIGAILKCVMLVVPNSLLTPTMVFVGIMSSMTLDAGYVVLPPLAAALYKAVGRSPLAGIAAVFAGVSAGFNANLFVTGLDPMLAGFSTTGAQVIDESLRVAATCNWYFMAASTVVMTLTGWAVTAWFVEHRLHRKSPDDGGPTIPTAHDLAEQQLKTEEKSGLLIAFGSFIATFAVIMIMILVPKAPLKTYTMADPDNEKSTVIAEVVGTEARIPAADRPEGAIVQDGLVLVESPEHFSRWVDSIVPILFFCFIIPAIVYGVKVGKVRNDKDVAKLLMESMAAMAPIIVLAFFAAQFTEYFKHSGLDKMLALSGGQALGQAQLSPYLLMVAFILVTMVFNLFVGSMSAKYALFAPIFIPMFMLVGISPELTQAAYRIGDSTSNIITPLNAYLVIILVFMQKYVPKSGMGTLISTMVPYTIVFTIVWTVMLMIWMWMGFDLGPEGPLFVDPTSFG